MLEKRKGRSRGGGGVGFGIDNWDAPPLLKAQMAFEIIWFCFILYLISTLFKVIGNVRSRQRQPYILLLVSAILLDIALIMDAIAIRINDTAFGTIYIALLGTISPLWQQPTALFTMAGLWVFRKRSQLLIYGKGARGFPYAGQMWKFVADWIVTSCSLLFLILSIVVYVVGYTLYQGNVISYFDFKRFVDAEMGLSYVQFAFFFILAIVFVVTGFTLSSAFKRQTGRPDAVRHFPTSLSPVLNLMQVTRQVQIWVMPWVIIHALYTLIEHIVNGINRDNIDFDYLSLELAGVIVNGACWTGVLVGFIKTAADPGPWDWSQIQAQQPQIAQYGVQVVPVQPSYYAPPVGPPLQVQQGQWGQNDQAQQHIYSPYAPPHAGA